MSSFNHLRNVSNMKFKTILKSPVFDFVKKRLAYYFVECLQPQQNDQNKSHY